VTLYRLQLMMTVLWTWIRQRRWRWRCSGKVRSASLPRSFTSQTWRDGFDQVRFRRFLDDWLCRFRVGCNTFATNIQTFFSVRNISAVRRQSFVTLL